MNKPLFVYESSDGSRQAFRTRVPGLFARDLASGAVFRARDISAGGISLEDEAEALLPGHALDLDVVIRDRTIISGLKAEVARRQDTTAGLRFIDPTQRQEERLDKLVLEVQKYLISKSKIGASHGDDEHET